MRQGYWKKVARTAVFTLMLVASVSLQALASTTATLTVGGSEQQVSGGWDQGNIIVAFNNFSETVNYGQFSSPVSLASGLAGMFSRDYLPAGLCASASGATITFKLKTGAAFGALALQGPTTSFQFSQSGFQSLGYEVADSGTVTLTINGTTYASTNYGLGATPGSISQGLAAGVASNSPVNVSAVNDALYLEAKTPGSASDYSYSLQTTSYDSHQFSQPSFFYPPVAGNLDGGADKNEAGQTVYSYSVTSYQPNGNLANVSDSVMGTWAFSYDNLNRLMSGTVSPAVNQSTNYCWSYDNWGNRMQQMSSNATVNGGGSGACQATGTILGNEWANYAGTNNQATSTTQAPGAVGYDAAGGITNDGVNQYLYDAEGRICAMQYTYASILVRVGYLYNAGGQRVAKGSINAMSCDPTTNGFNANAVYILDLNGNQLTEMATDDNGTMAWQHTNVYAGETLIATYDADNNLHFYLNDALGTKRVQTNYAGVLEQTWQSTPFGDNLTPNVLGTSEQHFTGKERDTESGNDYFGARYYANSMGRFMSPDWASNPTAVPYATYTNPQSLNLYSYMRNNPLDGADPDGHDPLTNWFTSGHSGSAGLFGLGYVADAVDAFGQYLGMVGGSAAQQQSSANPNQPTIQGVAASGTYGSKKAAAMAAEKAGLGSTRAAASDGKTEEFGGWVISKGGKYTYTNPVTFGASGVFYADNVTVPSGYTAVGGYHTHPDPGSWGEGFSVPDMNWAIGHNMTSYVGMSYSGNVRSYTPGVTKYNGYGVTGDLIGNIP